MKPGLFLVSSLIVAAFVVSTHFGAKAYFQTRQLKSQAALMTVRTRVMKQQVGELEQKMRVNQRVNSFMARARELQLTPEQWDQYDVNIQDAVTFKELAEMVEQCVHNKDLYYKPLSFHMAVGRGRDMDEKAEIASTAVAAQGTDQKQGDLALSLKGAFFVRH